VLDCKQQPVETGFMAPPLRFPEENVRYCAEARCVVGFDGHPLLDLGDAITGYGPTTVNLHDVSKGCACDGRG
jgi:hypothetical protein